MTMRQVTNTLGVRGLARAAGVPPTEILRAVGAEQAARRDLIDPNPLAANGDHAFAAACAPAMGCCSMGGLEEGTPSPTPAPSPGLTPGAVPFRAGNWNFDRCEYTLAEGDTMWGVATTYLGRGNRWLEIWQLQSFRWTKAVDPSAYAKNPSLTPIKEGDVFVMPKEACDRAKEMLAAGKPSAPPTPGAPGTMPGESKGGVHESAGLAAPDTKKKLLIAGGVVAALVVVGGIAYAAS
jgi:hypothetical protein